MPDPRYGKMCVIRALKAILKDSKATVKQRLDAAHLIATINGWEKPKERKGKTGELLE
jgi:hypothetical protein